MYVSELISSFILHLPALIVVTSECSERRHLRRLQSERACNNGDAAANYRHFHRLY